MLRIEETIVVDNDTGSVEKLLVSGNAEVEDDCNYGGMCSSKIMSKVRIRSRGWWACYLIDAGRVKC